MRPRASLDLTSFFFCSPGTAFGGFCLTFLASGKTPRPGIKMERKAESKMISCGRCFRAASLLDDDADLAMAVENGRSNEINGVAPNLDLHGQVAGIVKSSSRVRKGRKGMWYEDAVGGFCVVVAQHMLQSGTLPAQARSDTHTRNHAVTLFLRGSRPSSGFRFKDRQRFGSSLGHRVATIACLNGHAHAPHGHVEH